MAAKRGAALKQAVTGTSVAVVSKDLPEGVKVVRRITMPTLVMKAEGVAHTILIRDEFRISKIEMKEKTGKAKEPATICSVADVLTGEEFIWLVPAVVKSNLERDYPNAEYVGKVFHIKNNGKAGPPSRQYWVFSIAEVDVSGLTAKANAQKAA